MTNLDYDWKLTVEFDPIGQERSDESFPLGDAATFYGFLIQEWCMDEEDLKDHVKWEADTVTIVAEVLDYMNSATLWVTMNSIPKKLTLERVDR